jgi:hypothetical protein
MPDIWMPEITKAPNIGALFSNLMVFNINASNLRQPLFGKLPKIKEVECVNV